MNHLLLLCLTFLPIARCEPSYAPIQLPLLENSQVKVENGIDPNHLLVIECTNSNKLVQLRCLVTIHLTNNSSSDNCTTTLTANADMNEIELLSIHQLNDNRVMIVWGDMGPRIGTLSHFQSIFYNKRLTIVNMNRCTQVKTLVHRYFLGTRRRLQTIVTFDKGFDAIVTCHPYYETCSATRESYDVNGNEFAEIEAMPVQLANITAMPVARNDRSRGVFVVGSYDYPVVNVSHVVGGNVKRMLNLPVNVKQSVTHADGEGSLTICGRVIGKARSIECTHYDAIENTIVESRATLPGYIDVIGVRRLKNGDVLLFAIDGNTMRLVEVRNDRSVTHEVTISWKAYTGMCRLRGFNEDEGNFGLVCNTRVEGNRSLVTKTFGLPQKLSERLTGGA